MSENFVFSSFKKPNRVTKNAAVELHSKLRKRFCASRNGVPVADKRGEIYHLLKL